MRGWRRRGGELGIEEDTSEILSRGLRTCSGSFEQEDGKSKHDHLQTGVQVPLAVLPQAPAFLQPRETPLHDPPFRDNREAMQVAPFGYFDPGP